MRVPLPSQVTMLFHHGGRMYVTLWPSPQQLAERCLLLQFVELLPWKSAQPPRKYRYGIGTSIEVCSRLLLMLSEVEKHRSSHSNNSVIV